MSKGNNVSLIVPALQTSKEEIEGYACDLYYKLITILRCTK